MINETCLGCQGKYSLLYAKIMQAERNQACLKLQRRRLSYAKIMQAERNQACLKLLRRRLSYAKIVFIFQRAMFNNNKRHVRRCVSHSVCTNVSHSVCVILKLCEMLFMLPNSILLSLLHTFSLYYKLKLLQLFILIFFILELHLYKFIN